MRTKPSGHKHIDSRLKWTTVERVNSTGPDKPHDHEVDLTSLTTSDIEVLKSKLGLSTPIPPPVSSLPIAPTNVRAVAGDRKVTVSWQ